MRWLRFLLVLVLAVELALWEAFLVGAHPFGTTFPVAAALAVVGNLVLGRLGAAVLESPAGAAAPGVVWFAITLLMGTPRPAGDLVVTNTFRGLSLFVCGAVAASVAVVWSVRRQNALHLGG